MASESQSSPLRILLDSDGGVPFYRQIITQIEMAIADGRLSVGNQLPTVRGLAVDLQINPNTVARAYNELEIKGIVTTQQGTGTFISDKEVSLSEVERNQVLSQLTQTYLASASSYGFSVNEVIRYLRSLYQEQAK